MYVSNCESNTKGKYKRSNDGTETFHLKRLQFPQKCRESIWIEGRPSTASRNPKTTVRRTNSRRDTVDVKTSRRTA